VAPYGPKVTAKRYLDAESALRRLAPGGTSHPPGGLEAGSAWQHVPPAR